VKDDKKKRDALMREVAGLEAGVLSGELSQLLEAPEVHLTDVFGRAEERAARYAPAASPQGAPPRQPPAGGRGVAVGGQPGLSSVAVPGSSGARGSLGSSQMSRKVLEPTKAPAARSRPRRA